MSRRLARKKAFFIVYQLEFHKDFALSEIIDSTLEFEAEELDIFTEEKDNAFIYTEASGTYQNLEQIDSLIKKYCINWDFERLSKIDVAILRLALYEMLFREDIPIKVSTNEAIELAKDFGGDGSPNFINGILGKIIKSGEVNDK